MTRDRFATRAAIIESAAEIIAAKGIGALRVNALADAASCDKVLIYRYFGGLDGVLRALGAERMLWPAVQLEDGDGDGNASLADALCAMLLEEWAALAGGALMLGASSAELIGPNPLGIATARQRAEHHASQISTLRERHRVPPYVDLAALLEILSAALTIFALRAAQAKPGADGAASPPAFDPNTPAGWRRVEKTLNALAKALLEPE
jgi:AcrR family transcriptional regulator